jgi:hypothetical protein
MGWTKTQNGTKHSCASYTRRKVSTGDLNNYRGVCLQDLIVRYVLSIISLRLLKNMLKEHGIKEQLRYQPLRGCRDALFIVHSVLQLRHKHILPTRALFVDLVKAFDMIDRELMFQIVSKIRILESMIYVIRRLYDKNKNKLLMGTTEKAVSKT